MKQNKIQQIRESFHKQRRRNQLQQKFSQRRKKLTKQIIQKENQTFKDTLPLISQKNYEQNRALLSDFSRSVEFSYQLLPITWIAQDYLLIYPSDKSSWEILAHLSYYQDFQISQTVEFSNIVFEFTKCNPDLGSQFVSNISKLSKCRLLICRLIDQGLISLIEDVLKQKQYTYNQIQENKCLQSVVLQKDCQNIILNLLWTLSYIFTINPLLEIDILKNICRILNQTNKSDLFLRSAHTNGIYNLIQNSLIHFSAEKQILSLIVQNFEETIIHAFFVFENQTLKFIKYCINSTVEIGSRLITKVLISLKSKNPKHILLTLQILNKILFIPSNADNILVQKQKNSQYNFYSDDKQNNNMQTVLNGFPTFQQFNSLFTNSDNKKQNSKLQSDQKQIVQMNRLLTYRQIFVMNYEARIKLLLQIFQYSQQNIKQQVIILVKNLIQCLIHQIQTFQPQKFYNLNLQQMLKKQDFQHFLELTISSDQLFILLQECIKNSNTELIQKALYVLSIITRYFKYEISQQIQSEVDFQFLRNKIRKTSVLFILQAIQKSENQNIKIDTQEILDMLDMKSQKASINQNIDIQI